MIENEIRAITSYKIDLSKRFTHTIPECGVHYKINEDDVPVMDNIKKRRVTSAELVSKGSFNHITGIYH